MYQVLARKWRPKTFAEVIGQQHVLRALINALDGKRLHHAYLFTGTRGVGKTTLGRILAKCLNCEAGITSSPCCKCDACLEIDDGCFFDLIEVDAASRTKVEDTRELLENVQYVPAKGRFKIYLIDEVHMLSGHSFNALLKTLEEPPEHVKFLFATTDPQKLPITVMSRCLQFNLKTLPPELIQKHLQHILGLEKISYEDAALLKLAVAADGSVRDALSLLDQAIAYAGSSGKVEAQDVASMLGAIEHTHIFRLLNALAANDANTILQTIAELSEQAADFVSVIDELLNILHQISIVQLVPDVDLASWYDAQSIKVLADSFDKDEVQLYYQLALIGKRDLPLALNPKNGFEMLMLRMLAFRPNSITKVDAEVSAVNRVKPKMQPQPQSQPQTQTKAQIAKESNNNNIANSKITGQQQQKQGDMDILSKLKVTGTTQALIRHCKIITLAGDLVELAVAKDQTPFVNKTQQVRLAAAFSEYLQRPVRVEIMISGQDEVETLASKEKQAVEQRRFATEQTVAQDANINEIISKFGATIVPDSIEYEDEK